MDDVILEGVNRFAFTYLGCKVSYEEEEDVT
jgi:hypothetical protein